MKKILKNKIIIIYFIYTLFLVSSSLYFILINKHRDSLMSFLFIFIIPSFYLVQRILNIEFRFIFKTLILLIASGGVLGASYDLYHIIPFFDDVLHTLSGFIFCLLGYSIVEYYFVIDNKRKFNGAILMSSFFSLSIGLIWELFEFTLNVLFGFDMLADTIIPRFNSYLLSNTHSYYLSFNAIKRTIIEYGNNEVYIIDNGYLDLGSLDTMVDMSVCFIGVILFLVMTMISNKFNLKINEYLLPKIKKN